MFCLARMYKVKGDINICLDSRHSSYIVQTLTSDSSVVFAFTYNFISQAFNLSLALYNGLD